MARRVQFGKRLEWALLPEKASVDLSAARERASLYEGGFRWLRASRVAEQCRPWRLGRELGWIVRSPIDIRFTPLPQIEVSGEETDLESLTEVLGDRELWRRGSVGLAVPPTDWLRFYQYEEDDRWVNMFLPNGQGSVEWHLGWNLTIPAGCFVLVLPATESPDLEVPMGVMDAKGLAAARAGAGFSLAVRPRAEVAVSRGAPLARIVLLEASTLSAKADVVPLDPKA